MFEDKWDQVVGNIKAQQIIIEEIPLLVSPKAKSKHLKNKSLKNNANQQPFDDNFSPQSYNERNPGDLQI